MFNDVELQCPVCERVVQVQSASTDCPHCHAWFTFRPAVDGGYVFECETLGVDALKVTHPAVIGVRLFQVVSDRVEPEWLVRAQHGGVLSLELFLSQPRVSMLSMHMKV